MKRIIVIAGTVLLLGAYSVKPQSGGGGAGGSGGAGTGGAGTRTSGTGVGGTGSAGVGTAPNQGGSSINQPSGIPGSTTQPGLAVGQTPGLGMSSNSFGGATNSFGLGSNSFGLGTNGFGGTNITPMSPTGRTNSSSSIFGTNPTGLLPPR